MSVKRKFYSVITKTLMAVSAALIIAAFIGIAGYILYRGVAHISWEFLSTKPSLLKGTNGILPNILNTVYIVIMTLLVVLPLGVGSAIYLNEYAKNKKAVGMIELATETLAGIPSIIYGLSGMLIFCQFFSARNEASFPAP